MTTGDRQVGSDRSSLCVVFLLNCYFLVCVCPACPSSASFPPCSDDKYQMASVDPSTRMISHLQVFLSKRIPPEAGLGGGSSNAATALYAANELAGRPASLADLQLWSGELGSDITFFLSSGTCYCTGRGEILHPQEPLAKTRSVFWHCSQSAIIAHVPTSPSETNTTRRRKHCEPNFARSPEHL